MDQKINTKLQKCEKHPLNKGLRLGRRMENCPVCKDIYKVNRKNGVYEQKKKNKDNINPIKCTVCGDSTLFTKTQRCQNCWEIEHRIKFINDKKTLEYFKNMINRRIDETNSNSS